MTHVIAFANQKGGVGKTTSVVNLASAFSKLNKKVLVIDMDPQGNATTSTNINKNELSLDMFDVLVDDTPLKDVIQKIDAEGESLTFHIAPATTQLAGAELLLAKKKDREKILKKAISKIKRNYDYILIDNPPALSLLTISTFTAADSVIIPVQAEFYALEGLTQLIETIDLVKEKFNKSLEIEGFLMTMTSPLQRLSREVVKDVRKHFEEKVYRTEIVRNVRIAEAPSHNQSVLDYDRRSKGAKLYTKLAQEIIDAHDNEN